MNGDAAITLREITAANVGEILALEVSSGQREYVASNSASMAQARLHQEAWCRAIYAGDTAVGFLMLHDENLRDEVRQDDYYFLWRFMIDAGYQGLGYGRRAMALLIEHVQQRPNAKKLISSVRPGTQSPEGFYARLGFQRTGKEDRGEIEIELRL